MACVGKLPVNVESEMEEGEIIDELDDLSDISSEEEFLMRQRLEVLENYNNVIERTKAKRSSKGTGVKQKRDIVCQLSTISQNELHDNQVYSYKHNLKIQRHIKPHKQKRKKDTVQDIDENYYRRKKDYTKDHKKRSVRSKKRVGSRVNESSDESEDEYKNKRKKLEEAVIVPKHKNDKSSLSMRLFNMMHGTDHEELFEEKNDNHVSEMNSNDEKLSPVVTADDISHVDEPDGARIPTEIVNEPIELSTDDDVKIIIDNEIHEEAKDSTVETKEIENHIESDSDDDLELLRQHALESKPLKAKTPEPDKVEPKVVSEDEDSDTTELRLICLKSALLKKAIEMKQKQKLRKRLSTSNLEEDLLLNSELFPTKEDLDNNTDIESVDMDMGSDTEEKLKDCDNDNNTGLNLRLDSTKSDLINCAINNLSSSKEDELDEDEDLLRAKLLTSLSKNLTNLVTPEILNKIDEQIDEVKNIDNSVHNTDAATIPEEKARFIIQVNESDSEGEHEATKNLTKMHMKLAEQIDFQQKLDMFLKSTRNQVEKKDQLPDVVKKPVPKKPEKFVAKTVKHLPKSEQIEYKNLVRRMAELEKMKQTRQALLNQINQSKDTLKPRNVTIESQAEINNNLEEEIAKSRKRIAEESAKMLRLKEEATKLSQKYKIAATELRNITTAIALNNKQQRTIQNSLSKIRYQHQSLLKNSTSTLHSKVKGRAQYLKNIIAPTNKFQKENNPKEEFNNPHIQKAVKVSVVNDLVAEEVVTPTRLSIEIDVHNNKKVVKLPDNLPNDENDRVIEAIDANKQNIEISEDKDLNEIDKDTQSNSEDNAEIVAVCDHGNKRYYISVDDYKSPLDALGTTNWKEDPNAILCPFEVRGQCKDPDCKYLHTSPSLQ